MAQMQDTTAATVTVNVMRPVSVTVPRILRPDTVPALVRDACEAYATLASLDLARAVDLAHVGIALVDGGAVCFAYTDDKGDRTARVVYPAQIMLTKDGNVCMKGYCTLRGLVKCFRLDRCDCLHPVTFPGEMTPAEAA